MILLTGLMCMALIRPIATPEAIITKYAIQNQIDSRLFLQTAKCESGLNQNVRGDGGKSYGIWQIYLPAHAGVTMEQAQDIEWSTAWAAKKFKQDPNMWTCYRLITKGV